MAKAPIKFDTEEIDSNGFITVAVVAAKLGFSASKVYKLIDANLLRAYTVKGSSRRTKRLTPQDVYDYVNINFKENFKRVG
jgi:excisionase family DNA binding protein